MKNTADLIFAAEILPEHPVGAAFREDLIKRYVLLDTVIIAHSHQPVRVLISGPNMKVADEERGQPQAMGRGNGFFDVFWVHVRSA